MGGGGAHTERAVRVVAARAEDDGALVMASHYMRVGDPCEPLHMISVELPPPRASEQIYAPYLLAHGLVGAVEAVPVAVVWRGAMVWAHAIIHCLHERADSLVHHAGCRAPAVVQGVRLTWNLPCVASPPLSAKPSVRPLR